MLIISLTLPAESLYAGWLQQPVQVGEFAGQPLYQGYGYSGVAADDWFCPDPTIIGRLQWWGAFHGWTGTSAPSIIPSAWHIIFYSDVPPGVDSAYSHPGTVVTDSVIAASPPGFAGYSALGGVESVFFFEAMPEQPFALDGPAIYWISILPVYGEGVSSSNPWCWLTRPYFWGAAAAYSSDEPPYWLPNTSASATWDQAFVLAVPEPGSTGATLVFATFVAVVCFRGWRAALRKSSLLVVYANLPGRAHFTRRSQGTFVVVV